MGFSNNSPVEPVDHRLSNGWQGFAADAGFDSRSAAGGYYMNFMTAVVISGTFAQTFVQHFIDTGVLNLMSVYIGKGIRYRLATSVAFRIVWNIASGLPVASVIFGVDGLFTSLIFLFSNGLYESICRVYFYRKWKREYEERDTVFTMKRRKDKIKDDILSKYRKADLVIYHDQLMVEVEFHYTKKYGNIAEIENADIIRRKEELRNQLRREGLDTK